MDRDEIPRSSTLEYVAMSIVRHDRPRPGRHASSTTISSLSVSVWARTESSVDATNASALYTGTHTLTSGAVMGARA